VLADLDAKGADAVRPLLRAATLRRLARLVERRAGVPAEEAAVLTRFWSWYEGELHASLARYVGGGAAGAAALDDDTERFLAECERLLGGVPPAPQPSGDGALVFGRQPAPKGPMSVFGYDYLEAHLGKAKHEALALLAAEPTRGGGDYAYEALNLVDGRRSAQEIRDALTAIYGPVPLAAVVEYLRALEAVGVVKLQQ